MLQRFLLSVFLLCFVTSQSVESRNIDVVKSIRNAFTLKEVKCGNSTDECPTNYTCCLVTGSVYGCCDFFEATCCADRKRCCPKGYKCDLEHEKCIPGFSGEVVSTRKLKPILNKKTVDKNVICPDKVSVCPDGETCCKVGTGEYGCCPYSEGVCCKDNQHCCPKDYKCDASSDKCIKSSNDKDVPLQKLISKNIDCPDGTSCPDDSTCCPMSSGYGCCPLKQAVCCPDNLHCCPNGYVCDKSMDTCNKEGHTVKASTKITSKNDNNVGTKCDDGSSCPGIETCCRLKSGPMGCCPYPNAQCCLDGEHCCPTGYECNVNATNGDNPCRKKKIEIIWTKIPANDISSVACPDGQSQCPDGSTCCKLLSGQWGCCPSPNAVCCKDGQHCCPTGYTCDTGAGTCLKGPEVIKALMKSIAKLNISSVACPDGHSQCPDGNTCCKLSSGQYGCCPIPNAVCCKDHQHCCPTGYTCDTGAGTCLKGQETIKAFTKTLSLEVSSVICQDGRSECPDGSTCCKLPSGLYGCCPIPNAVCCKDHEHCCPTGYTCDTGAGTCLKGPEVIKALVKTIAKSSTPVSSLKPSKSYYDQLIGKLFRKKNRGNCVMCPDDSECPDFNTCCQLSDGKYGCCGFPSAVCCSDHTHCCAHGYTCDVGQGACIQQGSSNKPLQKMHFKERDFASKSDMNFNEM